MKLDRESKTILTICIVLSILLTLVLMYEAKAETFDYPVICSDAAGNIVLVADGNKVRVAQWDKRDDQPRFTDSRRTSPHKRVYDPPRNSVCRIVRQ
jgi:hypothetical protein